VYYGRRRQQRRAAFPLGTSILNKIFVGDAFIRSCTLHDLSEGGACLRVDRASDLPEKFRLVLDGVACRKNCRVVWRRQDNIGVAFDADGQTGAAQSATA
jgi:PilZ domain